MADGKPMKQSKLDFKPKKEKSKATTKGNPWSDSDGSEDLSGGLFVMFMRHYIVIFR